MTQSYLDMMEDSLKRKVQLLNEILGENEIQRQVLANPEDVEEKAFDEAVERKGQLIDQMEELNQGFQSLFDKVKQEIGEHKELYKVQIQRMQKLITEITELSTKVQAGEQRNKNLADAYFSAARSQYKQGQRSASAAINYYATMKNFNNIPPQYYDSKH